MVEGHFGASQAQQLHICCLFHKLVCDAVQFVGGNVNDSDLQSQIITVIINNVHSLNSHFVLTRGELCRCRVFNGRPIYSSANPFEHVNMCIGVLSHMKIGPASLWTRVSGNCDAISHSFRLVAG